MGMKIEAINCGQLNGEQSCDGCPVYTAVSEVMAESGTQPLSAAIRELSRQCALGGKIDLNGLGIRIPAEIQQPTESLVAVVVQQTPPLRRSQLW